MRYHCRCTSRKCQRRVVKKHHPTWYLRTPKCSFCSSPLRVDKWMQNRNAGLSGMGCTCDGYQFLHRKGSKYCEFRSTGERRLHTDLDYHDRYAEWYEEKAKRDNFFEGFGEAVLISNDWATETTE